MTFTSYLHPSFISFCQKLNELNFSVGVVGGTVRDYFLERANKHDYDCELRFKKDGDFLAAFLSLKDHFPHAELLNYNVLRISHDDFECELTLCRYEIFDQSDKSHSNFKVYFYNDTEFRTSFMRRDFTINAIMYLFDHGQWKLIDPLNGVQDIKAKVLRPCDPQKFFFDFVRVLRGIRFSTLFEFDLDQSIKNYLQEQNLSQFFHSFYFRSELEKSKHSFAFLYLFFSRGVKDDLYKKMRDIDQLISLNFKTMKKLLFIMPSEYFVDLEKIFEIEKIVPYNIKNLQTEFFKAEMNFVLKLNQDQRKYLLEFYNMKKYMTSVEMCTNMSVESEHIEPVLRGEYILKKKWECSFGN